jgi:hypothetical protein
MVSSFLVALGFFIAGKQGHAVRPEIALVASVAATTVIWMTVAFFTRPTDRATLVKFYELVRPAGPGWKAIRRETTVRGTPDSLPQALLGWVLGCLSIYAALFGAGSFLYGRMAQGLMWLSVLVLSGLGLVKLLPRMWAGPITGDR